MESITIVTDPVDLARHQANVDAFLADSRNTSVFEAFADADFNEDIADAELIDIVAHELCMTRIDVIERMAKIDFAKVRAELLA